jgi:Ca2+-binding EF-hand superfamily protein
METSIKTAFNVVFKEFITHIRNETSDKDLKAAIKQKYKKFETEGDVYISEFVLRT